MVQHQQVHQLVMQQFMMRQLNGGRNRYSYPYPVSVCAEPVEPVLVRHII